MLVNIHVYNMTKEFYSLGQHMYASQHSLNQDSFSKLMNVGAGNLLPRSISCGLCCKCLTIVIYYRYGKGQYYKTTIITTFALVGSIIYDCKIRS